MGRWNAYGMFSLPFFSIVFVRHCEVGNERSFVNHKILPNSYQVSSLNSTCTRELMSVWLLNIARPRMVPSTFSAQSLYNLLAVTSFNRSVSLHSRVRFRANLGFSAKAGPLGRKSSQDGLLL